MLTSDHSKSETSRTDPIFSESLSWFYFLAELCSSVFESVQVSSEEKIPVTPPYALQCKPQGAAELAGTQGRMGQKRSSWRSTENRESYPTSGMKNAGQFWQMGLFKNCLKQHRHIQPPISGARLFWDIKFKTGRKMNQGSRLEQWG